MSHSTLGLPGKASFLLEQWRMILCALGSPRLPGMGLFAQYHPLPPGILLPQKPGWHAASSWIFVVSNGNLQVCLQVGMTDPGKAISLRFRVEIKLCNLFLELFGYFEKISRACFETHQRTWEDFCYSPPCCLRGF